MRRSAQVVGIIVTLVLSLSLSVGQDKLDLKQLHEIIQRLEAVNRDPSTTTEVRKLNRRFLTERRSQLRSLLQAEIKALQDYGASVGPSLSADEKLAIESSIAKLSQELRQLEGQGGTQSLATATPEAARIDDKQPQTATIQPGPAPSPSRVVPSSQPSTAVVAPARSSIAPLLTPTGAQLSQQPACALYKKNPKTFSLVDRYVCNLIESIEIRKNGDASRGITAEPLAGLDLDADFTRLVIIMDAKKGRAEELVRAEEARVDKQTGSDSSSSGTTSLVTKGNVPAILGFAVENGAITQEVTGTTITFRGNPVGIFKALSGKGLIGGFDEDDGATRFLRRFSFAASFDTDRGPQTGIFTGSKQQLSGFSGRAVLYDKRDPRRGEYKQDWENFLATSALGFLTQDAETREALLDTSTAKTAWNDPALISWYTDTQRALAAALPDEIEGVLVERLNELPLDDLAPDTESALAGFEREFKIYLRDRDTILKKVGNAGVLTFDYTNQRNVNSPDLSNFKLIGEKGFYKGRLDLTGNASMTIYDSKPPALNIDRLRDFQAALQLDTTFGSAEKTGVFVLSFGYKYQHQAENVFTDAGFLVPNTTGNINVGQLKLTVPIKGLGIKFPISLTFANRTELIKEKEVRGNFGFTLDLDTIFARFKPF